MEAVLGFMVLALLPIKFNLIGVMSIGELILLFSFFYFFKKIKIVLKINLLRKVFFFFLIYIFSQILTDIYRNTSSSAFIREWAKLGVLGFSLLLFLFILFFSEKKNHYLMIGYYAGNFIGVFFPGRYSQGCENDFSDECMKWLWIFPATMLSIIIVDKVNKKRFFLSILVIFVMLSIAFLVGARNVGASLGIGLFVYMFDHFYGKKNQTSIRRLLWLFFVLASGVFTIKYTYEQAASKGLLGEANQKKFLEQSNGNGLDLKKGRTESQFFIEKILDSPIFGYGSGYADLEFVLKKRAKLGIARLPKSEIFPVHSYIGAGWLYAGFFGGIFWIVVIWIVLRNLLWVQKNHVSNNYFLFIFLSCNSLWNILFSPLGMSAKVYISFILSWHLYTGYKLGFDRILQFYPNNKLKS